MNLICFKRVGLFICGCLLPLLTLAQSNYQSGYVVLNSGDTLRGYINAREWALAPKTVEFKAGTAERKGTVYTPAMLKSFTITGADQYITYTGKISMDKLGVNDAPQGLDTTTRRDTVFLKLVQAGSNLSLLEHRDEVRQRFFIQETRGLPVELSYHQYYSEQTQLLSTSTYKGQLAYYARKYQSPAKAVTYIGNMTFSVTDMERALDYINQNQHRAQNKAPGSRFFIGAGAARGITAFDGDYNSGLNAYNKPVTLIPFISTGFDFFQNPRTQRLVFRAELAVSYNAPRFSYPYSYPSIGSGRITYSFNQLNFGINPQFIYNFYNSTNLKIYADVGANLHISSYSGNEFGNTGTSSQVTTVSPYKLNSGWLSFPFKVGVLVNQRFEVFAVYEGPTAYTDYINFSISTQTLGLGVHYCLGKTGR